MRVATVSLCAAACRAALEIKEQIERGVNITDRLNRFAHSTDETLSKIDLQETIEQLITLAQRFARLKHIVLRTVPQNQESSAVTLVTRHVQLQMALFAGIECWLALAAPGGLIKIGPLKEENSCFFMIKIMIQYKNS